MMHIIQNLYPFWNWGNHGTRNKII